MAFDRFLVGPINTGLQRDLKPFLIPDDAFTELQNAYVFRGRVRKRFGSIWMGPLQTQTRLAIQIGTTDGAGNLAFTALPGTILNVGAMFSAGNILFNVIAVPIVVGNAATLSTDQGPGGPAVGTVRLNSTVPNVYQFRITGGQAAIALAPVFFYPALPVMGITQYEIGAINNHPTYAFDTEFAYKFTGGSWSRSGAAIWHGDDTKYFWATNWQSVSGTVVLYVTNFNAQVGAGSPGANDDPIWYMFPQDTWVAMLGSGPNGIFFLPNGGARQASPFVQTARIILPFKDRLILLNTIENDNSTFAMNPGTGVATAYPQRCRYSFNGSPLALNAWYEQNQVDAGGNKAAGGGFIDAATDEQIISAEFIKDRLIVYFERSTWELAYTGNEVLPFVWQKLNTELGSQGTFSSVPFDTQVMVVGNTGIHACNGSNVARIDEKIPDEIFNGFKTSDNATLRISGIRDYYTELVYWIFEDTELTDNQNFANQILVYNYKTGSWALFDDCYTTFGYFEQSTDMTWASSFPLTWQEATFAWNDNIVEANKRQVLAGTPDGFVVILAPDVARNAPAMQITNIAYDGTGIITLTIINHNFTANPTDFDETDYILIENVIADGPTEAFLNNTIFPIATVVDANNITINTNGALLAGMYLGGGTGTRVSNVQIQTKWINPYFSKDRSVYLHKVDFAVSRTSGGAITVDYYPSSSNISMLEQADATGCLVGTGVLETSPYALYLLETTQEILWHPVYFQTVGESIQLALYFTGEQMVQPAISLVDFQLHSFILYTSPTSQRLE
jgi:hypothetical protein